MEKTISKVELASYIDHTLLKPDTTIADIEMLCREAIQYSFASVCVNPCFVTVAKKFLQGHNINLCTVVGFPLGATTSDTKAFETACAIENGANEIDMVINIGSLKERMYKLTEYDIKAVSEVCKDKALLKIIIEACLLSDEEKIEACKLAKAIGVDFIKTSTGFSYGGATIADIKLIKSIVGDSIGIKASGGIRDLSSMLKMIEAGASRFGTSSSIRIINQLSK